jgi:hemerythrin-like metal-binding protein
MKNSFSPLLLALSIGLIIVAIGFGFLFGLTNPVPWVLIGVLVLIPVVYSRMTKRSKVEWKEAYSVGIQALDDDHKRLLSLLDKFQTAYAYHTGDEFERQALNELVDYTKTHFAREELLLEQHGYPDLEAHKQEHREMIAKVDHFTGIYAEKGHAALGEVSQYLKDWLINHINGTDKQYTSFLQEKGVR